MSNLVETRTYSVSAYIFTDEHPENAKRFEVIGGMVPEGADGPAVITTEAGLLCANWMFDEPEKAQAHSEAIAEHACCGLVIELGYGRSWLHG